jgi:hypothetical protein
MGANTERRKFALCMIAMIVCGAVSALIAIDHPRHGWIAGWLGMRIYVYVERLIERAP